RTPSASPLRVSRSGVVSLNTQAHSHSSPLPPFPLPPPASLVLRSSTQFSSAVRPGCFSRRRYCFTDLCTLCGGVLSRPFTGAFGLGTRTVSLRLSLSLTMREARGFASHDARSGAHGTAATLAG